MQLQEFGWNKNSFWSLVVYLIIGGATFVVDVSIIFTCIHFFHVKYPHAVAIGFILGAFFNYAMNRSFVYGHSKQRHRVTLPYFFAVAFIWMWFTVGATVFLVSRFHIELYIARSLVGIVVAVGGYIFNSLFIFKIPRSKRT